VRMRSIATILFILAFGESMFVPLPFGRRQRAKTTLDSEPTSSGSNDSQSFAESTTTLAGPFLVRCTTTSNSCDFSFYYIDQLPYLEPAFCQSNGARSWGALHDRVRNPTTQLSPAFTLVATFEGEASLRVDCVLEASLNDHAELKSTVSLVLAQWASQRLRPEHSQRSFLVTWDDRTIQMEDGASDAVVRQWFGCTDQSSEIVEIVDRDGAPLGVVPRHLVHRFNLLHRGIGMFVSADQPISTVTDQSQPSVYVHRRTDTKRIFPSMYDMFVGGVSLAGEDGATTALREVAEELGLSGNSQQLSEPLLTCVVCTAYNRCVVTLFAYTMDQAAESIRWQAEEVAWGSFVPYDVVEAAADRSIMRWVDQDKWPGRVPPIQSPRHGNVSRFTDFDWTTWDIVPDGLLVWEAWLRREDAVHSSDVHDTATIVRNSTR
jgi:8-oxo-dGTP pyrophosphatase MutT (NUDIX family)